MSVCYVFDIDNTLTPPREMMTEEFADYFLGFCQRNEVYLVTGSGYDYVCAQIFQDILDEVKAVFPCAGTSKVVCGAELYKHIWEPNPLIFGVLGQLLSNSKWPHQYRYENFIEHRGSMINFSILGRKCPHDMRGEYFKWDTESGERLRFVSQLKELFPELSVTIGGETSMDLAPLGNDKSMILDDLSEFEGKQIIFFGDKCEEGGNDYPLAERIKKEERGMVMQVKSWHETFTHLENFEKGAN